MTAADHDAAMRAAFLKRLPKHWSRETKLDAEGDTTFRDDWVQGAWIGYQWGVEEATRRASERATPGLSREQIARIAGGCMATPNYNLFMFHIDGEFAAAAPEERN
ncbi:hypothetical protein IP92_04900 [Pseudoduganella flava]|uniref:Carboxymuconolactone decarboxylase family protein n=1 Tax=Pseudoduganella flava TaxID=871742 RepID=A0A562PHA7_9BURK|nr:hypothetical protein [Pseudoduganella flava]QGZ42679.1 hypothetical protein GO485_29040 [Pseudoduganella flava]TWI43845.1 hypothetical protein IP92_04900 [Pseudoduganella flava]